VTRHGIDVRTSTCRKLLRHIGHRRNRYWSRSHWSQTSAVTIRAPLSYDLCTYVRTQLTTCSQQATYCYMVLSSPSLCAQRSQREPAGQSDQNVGWNLRAIGWKSHYSSRASQTTTFWFYQCLSSRFSVCNQEMVASTTLWPMLQYLTDLAPVKTAVALSI